MRSLDKKSLIVKLPVNRDYCGEISLVAADGRRLAGPFEIAGRASDAAAARAGNPQRSPLFRYGDTPAGRYRLNGVFPTGKGNLFPKAVYGTAGVIVLTGATGDAALAEANGRYHVLIQAGAAQKGGRLAPTNGALRMHGRDLGVLLAALGDVAGMDVWCAEDARLTGTRKLHCIFEANEAEPPILPDLAAQGPDVSRRSVLGGVAALAGMRAAPVVFPGVFVAVGVAVPRVAMAAYDDNNDQPQPEAPQPDQDQPPPDDQNQNNKAY